MAFAKYFLFVTNLICWLAGVVFVGLGVAVLMKVTEVLELIPVRLDGIPISIIVFGSAVFVISFAGCCGAIKESKCLLSMYAVFMMILTGANLYLVYMIWANKGGIQKEWLEQAFKKHNDEYNVIENSFQCCGVSNATESYPTVIPSHCCDSPKNNNCNSSPIGSDGGVYKGCHEVFQDFAVKYGNIIAYSDIGIVFFQCFAIMAAVYLLCTIRDEDRRGKQFY